MTDQSPNPIFVKESVPRLGLFKRRPSPEPDVALVLYREGHPLITLWPGDRLTAGETVFGKYQTVYKVDVSDRSFSFQCALPCEGDAFEFQADVHVIYAVSNPAAIVEHKSKIVDGRGVLEPLIMQTLRTTSRQFRVEQSAQAEIALMRTIEGKDYDVGLKVKHLVVKLQPDKDAREHIRQLEEIKRRTEREKADIKRLKQVEAAQAALEEERREFERVKEEWKLEQKQRQMRFYSTVIKQLPVLQLANKPDDVPAVVKMLREQQQAEFERQLALLRTLVEEDILEAYQLEEAAKHVLRLMEGEQSTNSTPKSAEEDSD